jgi:RimJ/RimL family protein N-acetyltransferase
MRTFDASLFNRVCNHPEVRPWLGGEGELDVSPVLDNPQNYALWFTNGGFILHAGPGASFEVHSQFTPEGRRSSFEAMRAGMDYMFTRTNAVQLTTFLPDNNPAAKALGLKGGFKEWFRRDNHICGPGVQARIDIDQWITNTPALEKDGERFHDALEAAKKAEGSELPVHPHDPIHERYVGAAVRMCSRGHALKGVLIYSRWAVNAGYAPIRLISNDPPIVDAVDAIVGLANGKPEIIQLLAEAA